MPIDTKIEGDPASIRTSADWLNKSLATAVDQTVTDVFAVRDQAERAWQGDAGPNFHGKMDKGGRNANDLVTHAQSAGTAFNAYADDLTTAQAAMDRSRQIARDGGLELDADTILDPGAGPALPAEPASTATADQVTTYNTQVTAYNDHQAKVNTYAQAEAQANLGRSALDTGKEALKNALDDLLAKPAIVAADFANDGIVGALAKVQKGILEKQSEALAKDSESLIDHYLKTPGGTAESKALNLASYEKYLESDSWARRAMSLDNKVEARLPVVGLAITAVDVGYDISQGKPVAKAIVSGAVGFWAATEVGAAIGTAIPVPIVGTVVGALAGAAVGLVASGAADALYDQLPDGTKEAIEGGFDAIGHGAADAGKAVGHTAEKVWHSIF
jgi:uncharacterized protein YukE